MTQPSSNPVEGGPEEADYLPELASIELSDVGATSLTTLYCRALESTSQSPLLVDQASVELTRRLDPLLASSRSALHRQLLERRLPPRSIALVALRARHFDEYAREFARRQKPAHIVNLGCGFDTRFQRVDDGLLRFLDVDQSEILRLKRRHLDYGNRYGWVEGSVLNDRWLAEITADSTAPLFLAEGLLMYLTEAEVRSLVLRLQARFPGAELVADVIDRRWLRSWIRWAVDIRLRRGFCFGKSARFRSGLWEGAEMESWGKGIEYLGEWSVLDEDQPKLGFARILRRCEFIRRVHRVVHYRLNPA